MDLRAEHEAACRRAAVADRCDRALLRVTGRDRASWLHNLVTHHVKTVGAGEGQYAFALNVKGRILFDLNILVLRDALLLDLHAGLLEAARKHFDKYIIMEDVRLEAAENQNGRLAVVGPRAVSIMNALGCPQAAALPLLGSAPMAGVGADVLAFRTDFCGPPAFELAFDPARGAPIRAAVAAAAQRGEASPLSPEIVEILRIEAGIPASPNELNEDTVPAETGQLERAVSFNKGCYLGQEVVERMHARNVVARRLIGLLMEGGDVPPAGANIYDAGGSVVGKVTSACRSLQLGRPIGLGYVKAAVASQGAELGVECEARRIPARSATPPAPNS